MLRPQTDTTLLATKLPTCWMLHVASVCTPRCILLHLVSCCCRLRAVSLFSGSPLSKTRDTQNGHARDWWREMAAALVSRVSRLRRSRARALPLLNRKKKRDCSQSSVVGTCCAKFETGQTFSYVQTDATTPNNVGVYGTDTLWSLCNVLFLTAPVSLLWKRWGKRW